MSKHKPSPTPPAPASAWFTVVAIAVFSALFGATITWFALRTRPAAPAPSAGVAPAALNPDPTTHLPAPELTAGQPPAQAERTLGNFYYDHQNWPQAVTHYEAAIRQGSDDADIRTDLGNSYRFAGKPTEAMAQYTLAQQMNPAHEFSLFNQGGLYLDELKQPDKAVAIWQEYLQRFPTGQNVQAARQLIAQAKGGVAVPAAAAPVANETENLILQKIQLGQAQAAKP